MKESETKTVNIGRTTLGLQSTLAHEELEEAPSTPLKALLNDHSSLELISASEDSLLSATTTTTTAANMLLTEDRLLGETVRTILHLYCMAFRGWRLLVL